jgi:hypothetical protein
MADTNASSHGVPIASVDFIPITHHAWKTAEDGTP